MRQFLNLYKLPLLFLTVMGVLYGSFAYNLIRSDFAKLITLYVALFFLTHSLLKVQGWNFKFLVVAGILFRLIFLIAAPNLSQDFYRFLWDGQLVAQGVNPYLFSPEAFLAAPSSFEAQLPMAQELYQGMGALNGSHFTNYPPINQLFFALAGALMGKSVLSGIILLRIPIILADVGILYFGSKLLKALQLPAKNIFWYFLNPFIIIELTGNLHFEGVMLFFLLWGIYLLYQRKWMGAAVLWGLSISVKLIPLMLLPFVWQWFWKGETTFFKGAQKTFFFYVLVIASVLLTFLPFASEAWWDNFVNTTALWFQNFEFNASVYYIIRWIGYQTVGWNIIASVGKILPLIVMGFIVCLSLFRKNHPFKAFLTAMLFGISFYFLLATTVHPWYIATPLLLSLFTKYKFPIVWSLMVILSYAAYGVEDVQENPWLIALEYTAVILFFLWELFVRKQTPNLVP